MTTDELKTELNILLNHAAREVPGTKIAGTLISALASVMAITTVSRGLDRDDMIESARHQLDLLFIEYLRSFSNANS